MLGLLYSSVPVSHVSVAVIQRGQHQNPVTEAAKRSSAIVNFIIYTCTSNLVESNKMLLKIACFVEPDV